MRIYKLDDGNADCYVCAKSESDARNLPTVRDYFEGGGEDQEITCTLVDPEHVITMRLDGHEIAHTASEWEAIYGGFASSMICSSEW